MSGAMDLALAELHKRHASEEGALVRRLIEEALVAARGHRGAAAVALGVTRRRLERLVAAHVGAERMGELAAREGWPGVEERAAWARAANRGALRDDTENRTNF